MSESVRVYYDADTDKGRLSGRTFAVVGYGSQGHAHALNLRDSGVRVIVGLRAGSASAERAKAAGLDVRPVSAAAAAADTIMMLVPDQDARTVYDRDVVGGLSAGKTLMFAHGFNIHYGEISPPPGVDVSWSRPSLRAISCGASTRRAGVCRGSSPCTRTPRARRWRTRSPMQPGSAAPGPA